MVIWQAFFINPGDVPQLAPINPGAASLKTRLQLVTSTFLSRTGIRTDGSIHPSLSARRIVRPSLARRDQVNPLLVSQLGDADSADHQRAGKGEGEYKGVEPETGQFDLAKPEILVHRAE